MSAPEIWCCVDGDARYEVSSLGRVRSNRIGGEWRILTPSLRSKTSRYLSVRVANRTRYVHELVAEAFLGPRPAGQQINHRDGNKGNCAASNLEYVTQQENFRHALAMDLVPQSKRKVAV